MQIEKPLEKYAEQFNVKVRVDSNISPIRNAILVSKSFADSMTIYKTHNFTAKARKTEYGLEEFTKDIPNTSPEQVSRLNDNGIAPLNTFVSAGDIIIGEARPKGYNNLTPEDRLLLAIFGDKASPTMDISTYIPENISGVVTDIKIETRADNPKMEKYCRKIVTVSVQQSLPLMIGDIIEDNNGNKGIVVGYIDSEANKDDCSIIANFHFDGSKVIRNSSIIELQVARSTGSYNYLGKPYTQGLFNDPQKLSLTHLIKVIKSGHLKDLIQLVIGSADYKVRNDIYESIMRGEGLPHNHINVQFISRIIFLLNGMGVKCIFHSGGNTIDNPKDIFQIGIDKIINAEDLEISFAPLTDADIMNYSYGEVKSTEFLNLSKDQPDPKGIYSQQIFGTIKDWECACGKYKRIRYSGVRCENCGVEVTSSLVRSQRMGHLSFPIELDNAIFSEVKHSKALVMPPDYRPLNNTGYNQYASSDINQLYKTAVSRSRRLVNVMAWNAGSIKEIEQRYLAETYNNLFFGINGKYRYYGYIDYLFNNLQDSIENVMLDYSAATRAIAGKNIRQGYVGIPLNIALSIYSPYIIRELVASGKAKNTKIAREAIKKRTFIDNDNNSFIECITKIFNDGLMPNILLVSDGEKGEALYLSPIISDKPAFELNEQDYARLNVYDVSESVKAFLPPASNSVDTDSCTVDSQVNEIIQFSEQLKQYAALSKTERDNSIVSLIRNTHGIDVNSFVFCYLTGRGFSPSERQEALSPFDCKHADCDSNGVPTSTASLFDDIEDNSLDDSDLDNLFNDFGDDPFADIDGDDEE